MFFGGLEKGLQGDPRGWAALQESTDIPKFIGDVQRNWPEAVRLVKEGDLGRHEGIRLNPENSLLDIAISAAPTQMTAGDVTGRNILTNEGFDPKTARRMTMTDEPEGPIGHLIANINRFRQGLGEGRTGRIGRAAIDLMLPFKRTNANVVEAGWERLPGAGIIPHWLNATKEAPIDWKEVAAQQLIAAPVSYGAYKLGESLDPSTARGTRRVVSNVAGPYSLPANIAFTLGQGSTRGTNAAQQAKQIVGEGFPIPTTEPMEDLYRMIFGDGEFPRQFYPTVLRDIANTDVGAELFGTQPIKQSRIRHRRSRRRRNE